jgi:DNA-binding response OmpR family regulator
MDVFITKLRKKIAQDSELEIVNVRGYGYKLMAP